MSGECRSYQLPPIIEMDVSASQDMSSSSLLADFTTIRLSDLTATIERLETGRKSEILVGKKEQKVNDKGNDEEKVPSLNTPTRLFPIYSDFNPIKLMKMCHGDLEICRGRASF